MKFLIAVKSDTIAKVLTSYLPMHDIHICHNGADALEMIEMLHPDVLVLDLTLPIINGISILDMVCFKPRIILAFTALTTPAALAAAARVGVQEIVPIPCNLRVVAEHLEKLIERFPHPEA